MKALFQSADSQFWRQVRSIAVPVAIQSLLFSMLALVDALMVASLGEQAVAAVGLSGRVLFFNLLAIIGSSAGVAILAAQYFGANNIAGVKRTLAQAFMVSLVITLPFVLLYLFAPDVVIGLAGGEAGFSELATQYLLITGWTVIFTAVAVPIESMLRAVGEAKMPTYISVFAVVLNAGLNALLIFGLWGFPQWGVMGAAVGTAVSRFVQTVMLVAYMYQWRGQYAPRWQDYKDGLAKKARQRYFSIAVPAMLQNGGWALGTVTYSFLLGHISISALAVMSILGPIESLVLSGFFGLGVATATLVGQELGAEQYERAWNKAWLLIISGVAVAMCIGPLTYLTLDWIKQGLVLLNTPELDMALQVLLILAFAIPLRVFNMMGISGALRSGGDMKYAAFIDIFGLWGIGIPIALFTIFVLGWPLPWVIMAILTEEVVKIVLVLRRIHGKRWLANLVNEPETAPTDTVPAVAA
ncbi:MATE family efflux transporter [Motilimonas sp. E26]|uniref:MATE family efflux transporter n=1 Tax=Motilimonas sp. E26 TaxID=2865674 RepID=UPI001E28FE5F|nr:MATE family efflux transporter [Motilimonas sp. E26]MCE0555715.1 MATE family efflux transporter [Motilimonas sp. E26]